MWERSEFQIIGSSNSFFCAAVLDLIRPDERVGDCKVILPRAGQCQKNKKNGKFILCYKIFQLLLKNIDCITVFKIE